MEVDPNSVSAVPVPFFVTKTLFPTKVVASYVASSAKLFPLNQTYQT